MFPSAAIVKSEMEFNKFELFPLSKKAVLLFHTFLGREFCVGWTGRRAEANARDATGFHSAILDTYCGICR